MNNESVTTQLQPAQEASLKKLTLIWVLTMLALFPILALLGGIMRTAQANLVTSLPADRFYSFLTLHGVGMVGTWFVAAMAGAVFCLRRYVAVSVRVNWIAFFGTVLGVVLLLACTLIGKYGAGWYFLYPLPFKAMGAWQGWATAMFFSTLAVLGVSWTLWSLDLVRAIAMKYSLPSALGWNCIRGKKDAQEVPPVVLISLVATLSNLVGLVTAVVLLVLLAIEHLGAGTPNDALLLKNLTFLFGHLLVNITLYFGVAMVYELLPTYSGRPWKTSKLIAIAWNVVLLLVIFAYFHHLYMDFVQLRWMQMVGQISSYMSAIPAAVMSIFGAMANVYRSRMRWTMASSLLFLGMLGWVIGGIGAVIDSTVAVNLLFHNTLWVPAHFHTYFLMGLTLMVLGGCFHIAEALSGELEKKWLTKLTLVLMCVGGYGFLLMFYISGADSVPRRYASYAPDIAQGIWHAKLAVAFVAVFMVGLLIYIWETGRRCISAFRAA